MTQESQLPSLDHSFLVCKVGHDYHLPPQGCLNICKLFKGYQKHSVNAGNHSIALLLLFMVLFSFLRGKAPPVASNRQRRSTVNLLTTRHWVVQFLCAPDCGIQIILFWFYLVATGIKQDSLSDSSVRKFTRGC